MTINLVFKHPMGAVIGDDARMTADSYIESDEDHKLFTIYSTRDGTLFGTLMGHYEPWHKMYTEVVRKENPRTVEAAYNAVKRYMESYMDKSMAKIKTEKISFGTLIVGYDKQKGACDFKSIQMLEGLLDEDDENTVLKVIGSGGDQALTALSDKLSPQGDFNHLNLDEAKSLAYEAMFKSCVYDPESGGNLRVTILHQGGFNSEVCSALEVYKAYHTDYDEKTLLLFYPIEQGQLYGAVLNKVVKTISPGPKFRRNIMASHVIARTAEYYIHRIVYRTVKDAQEAYAEIENIKSSSIPDSLDNVRHLLWSTKHPYYIGKSSLDLVQAFLDMDPPDNLVYFKGVI